MVEGYTSHLDSFLLSDVTKLPQFIEYGLPYVSSSKWGKVANGFSQEMN